jgi:protein-serine/threonine kinase
MDDDDEIINMEQIKEIENDDQIKKITNNKLTIDEFLILKVVGKGSYGKVLLVRKKDDNGIYAMKVLKKKYMIKKNQVEHIKTERQILEMMDFPFIIKLKFAFQNEHKLYLVMDYCPGGELFFHIQRVERFNEEAVKFYAAQLILAIEYLHKNNIVYRDLKPENVLIDKDGYIKITDFGLSKQNILDNHSANSFCGTPEYLAPEIILNKGHGKAVDWWSLGAIVYEMLTGLPPFYSKDKEKLFNNIKNGNLKFPNYLSANSIHFLKSIFVEDPDFRLGSGLSGTDEIKNHVFFKELDWDLLLNKKIKPPFIPRIQSNEDTKYIDNEFTNCTPIDSPCFEEKFSSDNHYPGFSYNNDQYSMK